MTSSDLVPLEGIVVEVRSPEEWAGIIRADLSQAVLGFIMAGQHLRDARQQIEYGKWEIWLREDVGISRSTAYSLMAISEHPMLADVQCIEHLPPSWGTLYELSRLEPPLLEAAIDAGDVHPDLEREQARKVVAEYKMRAAGVHFDLRHGDFQTVLEDLEPGTVDVIITDPPYSEEYLPLYEALSAKAAIWLKPGGLCAVMSGQTYLPQVFQALVSHLDYHWTMAYLTPGGQAVQVFPRKVITFWKPIILCRNGEGASPEWFGDVPKSDVNDNDKRFHEWGQSESGMADVVSRLTQVGELVLDPFMGAGTTGVAALARGRSFIGCDLDAENVETARTRLEAIAIERLRLP